MSPILIIVLFCLVVIMALNLSNSPSSPKNSYPEMYANEQQKNPEPVVMYLPTRTTIEESFIKMIMNAPHNVFLEASSYGMSEIIINDKIKRLSVSRNYDQKGGGTISITDYRTNRRDYIELSEDEIEYLRNKFETIATEIDERQRNENLSLTKTETYEADYIKNPSLYIVDDESC